MKYKFSKAICSTREYRYLSSFTFRTIDVKNGVITAIVSEHDKFVKNGITYKKNYFLNAKYYLQIDSVEQF